MKNIPYTMTKFTIFDLSTEKMYQAFPAAQEDIRLSLAVSLIGGILKGASQGHWLELLTNSGVPCSPVHTVHDRLAVSGCSHKLNLDSFKSRLVVIDSIHIDVFEFVAMNRAEIGIAKD